jgi:hypothetical protein
MAKQTINIGAAPNDGTGTPLRTSFDYCNQNFTELYTATGPSGNNIVVPGTATITGNLTVDTNTFFVDSANNRVGIKTATPAAVFQVASGNIRLDDGFQLEFGGSTNSVAGSNATNTVQIYTNNVERYSINSTGVSTWSVGGSTAMTLNSTGLGVGVTPSAWASIYKTIELPNGASMWGQTDAPQLSLQTNAFLNSSFQWIYKTTAAASNYRQNVGTHLWFTAPSGTAGNVITFTQAMTLDSSARLLVNSTSAFTDLTGSREVKIGDSGMQTLTVASLPAATATNIARGGVGGLVYVGGFNGTGQYGAVVLWTAASATVVSVINGTGSTITFGVSAGFLQITSSLVLTQVTASCIRI